MARRPRAIERASLGFAGCAVIVAMLAGCVTSPAPIPTDPPATPETTPGDGVTPVPAGGSLAAACPTLAEAKAAIPDLVAGPDINTEPFKTMVLQCNYWFDDLDVQGRKAGVGILVFDASAEGSHLWDSARTDPAFPNATDIPGLAEVAFSTGTPGHNDVWVVQGRYGFHMSHLRKGGVPLDGMVALARAMVAGLSR